ncbi:hypothetical protein BB561_006581 [Smittium simulii]|uniref:Uncharacterized protein n=1 Tax=Smittium simulii TaxID=133385 RepID=A0A2T9Y388_9FUNG|nr:hypothetical protein BB561_006581 [Smittium simulii]
MNVAIIEESEKDQAHLNITPALLKTLNLHLNEQICFKLNTTINNTNVSVLIDSGSQITSITKDIADRLQLPLKTHYILRLRMGNNTSFAITEKITTATICFEDITFKISFRIMGSQSSPGSIDCLPNTDPEITAILREFFSLFDSKPSIIDTDFSHQLRLTADQPIQARIKRYFSLEAKILNEHIKKLYQFGYAQPSTLPYSANPLIAPKANEISENKIKAVKNFPQLNSVFTLLEIKHTLNWNSNCDNAFQTHINAMTTAPNGLTDALSRDFKEDDADKSNFTAVQTRSQGSARKTIRQLGQLNILANSSSDNDINFDNYLDLGNLNEAIDNDDHHLTENI